MAYTSLKATAREDWYFESVFSRHMTDEVTYLNNVKSCAKDMSRSVVEQQEQ